MSAPPLTVCVFCGSSSGADAAYLEGARMLGGTLARRGHGVVYGGARFGLMGGVADGALEAGGTVTGVLPTRLFQRERAHPDLTELVVVHSMHERKAEMARRADAFVALPGGLGTLEELFEVLTWSQLGIHRKPVAVLNLEGYFDGLLHFLDHQVATGFVRAADRLRLAVAGTVDDLLDSFEAYEAPPGGAGLDLSES